MWLKLLNEISIYQHEKYKFITQVENTKNKPFILLPSEPSSQTRTGPSPLASGLVWVALGGAPW